MQRAAPLSDSHHQGGDKSTSRHHVSQPGDSLELEAERVADQVMRMTASGPSGPVGQEEEPPEIARAPASGIWRKCGACAAGGGLCSSCADSAQPVKGGGQPLDRGLRDYFEPRFGRDFSAVRLHTDTRAAQSAVAFDAQAYTHGQDIAFAPGAYAPGTRDGRRLIAHELTHTVQQSTGGPSVQRGGAGIFGGTCRNASPDGPEWALVGDGEWKLLHPFERTEMGEDCDGMTCGGGFYHVDNMSTGTCVTPRQDDAHYRPRRWTPDEQARSARSPEDEGSQEGNTPPGYSYDRPGEEPATPEQPGDFPATCVVNPEGAHLPPMGRNHHELHPLEPCLLSQSEVEASPDWCRDSGSHRTEVCFRSIPDASGDPGNQYCYAGGCCHNGTDEVSIVSPDSPGSGAECERDGAGSFLGHVWEDVVPEFVTDPGRVIEDVSGIDIPFIGD